MTLKLTLATVGTLVGIVASGFGLYTTVKKYIDDRETANTKQVIEHERHDEEIDRRLDRLELAVRMAVSNDSQKQQNLIDQVLQMKTQLKQVAQTQDNYIVPKLQRQQEILGSGDPADSPAVPRPQ